jgi:hypothetical protein
VNPLPGRVWSCTYGDCMDARGVLKVLAWTVASGCFAVWAVLVPTVSGLADELVLAPMPWTGILIAVFVVAIGGWVVLQLLDAGPDFEVTSSPGSIIVTRKRRSTAFNLVHGEGNIGSTDVIGLWAGLSPGIDLKRGETHRWPLTSQGPVWFAWIDGKRLRSPSIAVPPLDVRTTFSGHESGSESGR